jgi:hypothetical protein
MSNEWTPEQIERLLIAMHKDLKPYLEAIDIDDMTNEQAIAELEAQGVDVDAALARFQERMKLEQK